MSVFPANFQSRFGLILCDPPWAFRTYSAQMRTPTQKGFNEAADHYSTMDFAELAALPVADVAAKDCALVMWAVGSHIDVALDLGRAWGFTFKTDLFYWMKQKMVDAQQIDLFTADISPPPMSMGYYTRKGAEPAYLFTRGSPRVMSHAVRQVIVAQRREHSRKPDEIYRRCEALFAGPYLEMFARQSAPGWEQWGNETDKFVPAPVLEAV